MIARKLVVDRLRMIGEAQKASPSQSYGGGAGSVTPEGLLNALVSALESLSPGCLKGVWWPYSGIVLSGASVTRWRDARTPTVDGAVDWVFTGAARPTTTPSTLRSNPDILLFDGTNDVSDNNSVALTNNIPSLIVSAVARNTDVSGLANRSIQVFQTGTADGRVRASIDGIRTDGTSLIDSYAVDGGAEAIVFGAANSGLPASPKRYTAMCNYAADLLQYWFAGASQGTSTYGGASNTSATNAIANVLGGGSGKFWQGTIAGFIWCQPSSATAAAARTLIDAFWADIFGSSV